MVGTCKDWGSLSFKTSYFSCYDVWMNQWYNVYYTSYRVSADNCQIHFRQPLDTLQTPSRYPLETSQTSSGQSPNLKNVRQFPLKDARWGICPSGIVTYENKVKFSWVYKFRRSLTISFCSALFRAGHMIFDTLQVFFAKISQVQTPSLQAGWRSLIITIEPTQTDPE